jgi:hypothetical protein
VRFTPPLLIIFPPIRAVVDIYAVILIINGLTPARTLIVQGVRVGIVQGDAVKWAVLATIMFHG